VTADGVEVPFDRFVDVDGVRLRVRAMGEGPPMLLIMGVAGNAEMRHPFDRELKRCRIYMVGFDAPATGSSGELDRPRPPGSAVCRAAPAR
jgi:pimeloyl-ACP methyl ester carboxylesterase